ncbi:hypothetical protein ABPG72_005930 [Tetrahymena utriculariae]
MDQINQDKSLKCAKHKKKQIELIQVINTQNENQNQSFFYCPGCIYEDQSFDNSKYLQLDEILDEGHKNVIKRWPPINDYKIIEKLSNLCLMEDANAMMQDKIVNFFNKLRDDILSKLDIMQKKMVELSLQNTFQKQKLVKQYQDISNIITLRQLLLNHEGESSEELQTRYKQLVKEMEQKKDQTTNHLQSLLNISQTLQGNVNFEHAAQIRNRIISQIDEITFFNQDISQNNSQHANNSSCQQIVDQIVTLVSNKTNFCSDAFLLSLREQLQKTDPLLLTSISNKIFQENKQPIDFYKLNEEQLQQISEFVHHSVNLAEDKNYENQIKDSTQIQSLITLIGSESDLFDDENKLQLKKFFIEIFPFLKKININRIDRKNIQNILPLINFKQLNPCNLVIQKNEDHSYQIKNQSNDSAYYCYSDLILDVNKKYIFKFQVKMKNPNSFAFVGLTRLHSQQLAYNHPVLDNFSLILTYENSYIKKHSNSGIDNQFKGSSFQFKSEELLLELRIDLQNNILQISDLPKKENMLALTENVASVLFQEKNLVMYVSVRGEQCECNLLEAKQVNQFQ